MSEHGDEVRRRTFLQRTGVVAAGTSLASARVGADPGDREHMEESQDPVSELSPNVIAHRGFAGVYPENTVGAAEAASRGGRADASANRAADMVEIDVMPTADGDVVVFHDTHLSGRDGGERGLTDASGVVWETPTETVTSAEVLETGETVPLLTEVLDAIPSPVGVNIEFKNPGSADVRFAENLSGPTLETQKERWRPFTEDVLEIASRYDNEILVSSFYEAAIATVREVDSSVPVAFLFWDSIEDGLDITRTYDCEALHPPYNLVEGTPFFGDEYYFSGPFADVDLVDVAHREGREVNVWTLATHFQARKLAAAGVDGLIADYPGLLSFGARR
ncbi:MULTISPECIES: glycerophosphodiester phosphodiesterase [Halorussus]|uniref:glycerophosphodiester phosphodiesterase n=1 Tax=Halorussus TaxID=1070314 RepID=UPI0020A1E1B7|nr:glycerophosphodiester phosphodiesterase [Halorussus vallis]USZ74951.1 glycerophosphodiester phosphodiesterase [Halorussus vallis]